LNQPAGRSIERGGRLSIPRGNLCVGKGEKRRWGLQERVNNDFLSGDPLPQKTKKPPTKKKKKKKTKKITPPNRRQKNQHPGGVVQKGGAQRQTEGVKELVPTPKMGFARKLLARKKLGFKQYKEDQTQVKKVRRRSGRDINFI